MRRRKISLKCCVLGIGVPVFIWFTFNVFNINIKITTDWFTPSPDAGKLHIKARKNYAGRRVVISDQADRSYKHSQETECNQLKDEVNEEIKLKYDVDSLHDLGFIKTPEDQKQRDKGYQQYAFNDLISSRIGFHRDVPDSRSSLCKDKKYTNILLTASIVICFYDESVSALLRTVHSVLDRTPSTYLKEILLVDDSSSDKNLSCQVESYVKRNLPLAKYIHTPEREGLIRARVFGASHATGDVIVFLDSHCEVNAKWIEPLLSRITESQTNVVVPVIDIINSDTMEYTSSPLVRGGFNWGMHFKWDSIPQKYKQDPKLGSEPIESPTMAGGLFAIDREYFHQLGEYDTGMDIWGGENVEISFRIWQCGGRLEILPCSRVGHIFRKRRPYGSPKGEDTMLKNSLRVAHVWMDEYKKYFLKHRPESQNVDYGDISDRISLRKRLGCKSFEWYLKNVYPELALPDESGKVETMAGKKEIGRKRHKPVQRGQFMHAASNLCIQSEQQVYTKKALLTLKNCATTGKDFRNQFWSETKESEFILAELLCLDIETRSLGKAYARLMKCHGGKGSQEWIWTVKHKVSMLYNPATGKCLSVTSPIKNSYLTVDICGDDSNMGFKIL